MLGRPSARATRASKSSSVASPQANEIPSAAASCRAAAIPQGRQGAGEEGAQAVAIRLAHRLAGGQVAAAAGELDVHHIAGAELHGAGHVGGPGDRLVGRDRHAHARAHLGQLLERPARLLHELEVEGLELPIRATASSGPQAPFASSRSAGQEPTASRTAATRSRSSGRPTLTLKQE